MSFDDDNELFRQDTDAESEGEDQVEGEEEEEQLLVELAPAGGVPASSRAKGKEIIKKEGEGAPIIPPCTKKAILATDLKPPFTQSKPKKKKKKPLTLIELPVDVLKEIVKEVNHTNDLTNLSLTCHCLHALAIPHIYSRFDIVWPDALTPGDRTGVDALTYGLATLVASGVRGNDYARWVKKFSLGNGPAEWVSDYNINKEGGKMLGTLVCLAITRMISLETFSWDMPTGVLRDVFKALHDLNGRLKNVHVRFHDNTDTTTPTSQDPRRRVETPTFKGFKGLRSLSVLDIDERQYLEEISYAIENSVDSLRELRLGLAGHVPPSGGWIRDLDEIPSSINTGIGGPLPAALPAVGGVLGVIVSRIIDLEEGRRRRKSTRTVEGANISTPSVAANLIDVSETVVMPPAALASVYLNADTNVEPAAPLAPVISAQGSTSSTDLLSLSSEPLVTLSTDTNMVIVSPDGLTSTEVPALPFNIADPNPNNPGPPHNVASPAALQETVPSVGSSAATITPAPTPLFATEAAPVPPTVAPRTAKLKTPEPEEKPTRQLKLETLELERVPISVRVLIKGIDWTCLSNLTILNCYDHDRLWKALRQKFSPHQNPNKSTYQLHHTSPGHRSRGLSYQGPSDYRIRLKKLHTDTVTPQLLYFIRDTLPPNSLEVLFLQETPNFLSAVPAEFIYRAAIRRHKGSLKKLLIDSNVGNGGDHAAKWIFEKEVLAFVGSGKMPQLRELGMAIDWKNWHYFLTRLPLMQQLRSLYIHYVRGGPHITEFEAKEMAQQIVNTVILRPEIELCYVGVMSKCFELLEDGGSSDGIDDLSDVDTAISPGVTHSSTAPGTTGVPPGANSEEDDSDGVDDEDDVDEDEDDYDDADDGDETDTDADGGAGEKDSSEDEEWVKEKSERGVRVRLREILFYDDKVAVFRARSGKL
ncbi:hypothetical protein P167DRAFT_494218 [Morchella conica CCBAS932]|uniref:F-box domain-containing protein n=1 Tax=Morchella conica CCBAS932 TaxID=1392247 RepID=A0A3N4KD02_9PEZI|nr:hypothetical protein P167DRAFT_494218 [Morchella conica CCBAS932]